MCVVERSRRRRAARPDDADGLRSFRAGVRAVSPPRASSTSCAVVRYMRPELADVLRGHGAEVPQMVNY